MMAAMTVVMDLMSSTAVRNLISPESHNKYVGIFWGNWILVGKTDLLFTKVQSN